MRFDLDGDEERATESSEFCAALSTFPGRRKHRNKREKTPNRIKFEFNYRTHSNAINSWRLTLRTQSGRVSLFRTQKLIKRKSVNIH